MGSNSVSHRLARAYAPPASALRETHTVLQIAFHRGVSFVSFTPDATAPVSRGNAHTTEPIRT